MYEYMQQFFEFNNPYHYIYILKFNHIEYKNICRVISGYY